MINLYPLAAAIDARPIPVLPDVGSMIVAPGLSFPLFSASSIISLATLSLTLPAGLKYSSFASILAGASYLAASLSNATSGVPPINSDAFAYILP